MRNSTAACLLFGLLATPAVAGVTLLSRDPALAVDVPAEAWDGPGCWLVGDRYFVCGHSTPADSLGEAKSRRYERDLAEEDAKHRLGFQVVQEQDAQVTEDAYDFSLETSGFQPVATYRIEGRDGLFLIGVVKKAAVNVHALFSVAKARRNARGAFEDGDFARAARLFAALTQHGVQDAETVLYAHAASAHLNLRAGATKATRMEALQTLSDFYDRRGDAEMALQFSYELYRETAAPPRVLLERLARLSSVTHREDNATSFRNEMEQRWPHDAR